MITKFTPGLTVKLVKDIRNGDTVLPSGTVLVIAEPFETTSMAGWTWSPAGDAVPVHRHDADVWDCQP